MKLISAEHLLNTPTKSSDSLARQYVRGFAQHWQIANVSTHMALLETETQQLVVSINHGNERAENCYVVSPLTAYSGYAIVELKRMRRLWLTWPLQALAIAVKTLLSWGQIDKVVWINNWLLSTNLYASELNLAELTHITSFMKQSFADHTLGFRSINDFNNPGLRNALYGLGYLSIPSRQVYIFDGRNGPHSSYLRRHNCRLDLNLLRRSQYKVVSGELLNSADFQRIEYLYNLLYLQKYSQLNPQYSAHWIERGQREGWLELHVLRGPDKRIDGVVGWFSNSGILSAPIVGYDTKLPQKTGLYRQLTALCLQEAALRREVLNFSAGASGFKRLRGGQPKIEYSLVYVAHLSWPRRYAWMLLSRFLHTLAVPLMKRLEL